MEIRNYIKALKMLPALVLILCMVSCIEKEAIVEDLHISIKTVSTEDILIDYFAFSDSERSQAVSTYDSLFQMIKDHMDMGTYEVMSYTRARKDWADVALVNPSEDQSSLVVVKYANGEYLYVKFDGNKVQSMITVRKGDLISGWL